MDHAVDALFDADEDAVVGDASGPCRAILSPGLYFSVKSVHGSGSSCLRPRLMRLALRVDLEHLALDLLADLEELRRVLDLLGPAHLADVDEALDARLELDERAVVGDRHDLAADLLARRVRLLGVVPRIFLGLLEAERDALGLGVVLEDLDGDLVADLEHLARVVDAAPAHVGDVEQAVDAAEVDERAVLGDVLDDALDDHALCRGSRASWPSSRRAPSRGGRGATARCCRASC